MRYSPASALLMGLFVLDLFRRVHAWPTPGAELRDFSAFLAMPDSWMIVLDLLGVAIAGGGPGRRVRTARRPDHPAGDGLIPLTHGRPAPGLSGAAGRVMRYRRVRASTPNSPAGPGGFTRVIALSGDPETTELTADHVGDGHPG